MDIRGFQVWLSAARGLTRAQRREALAVLSGRSEGEASKAAIELGVDEARRCPHCAREGAVRHEQEQGKGETVKASAARCDVAVSTAFRWRHRFHG